MAVLAPVRSRRTLGLLPASSLPSTEMSCLGSPLPCLQETGPTPQDRVSGNLRLCTAELGEKAGIAATSWEECREGDRVATRAFDRT